MFLSSSFTITNSNLIPWYHSLFLALGVGAPRKDRWRLCHNQHSVGCLSSPTHLPSHSSLSALGLLRPHPISCFFHAVSLVVFQELSRCPHVSPPPPLGCCFLQKQQIAVMLSFWSNEKNSHNNDVHVCLSMLFSNGAWTHTSLPESYFFCRSYLSCYWCLSLISLSRPSPKSALFSFALTGQPSEPWHFTCPPCGLLLLCSKIKPFTHSKCRNYLDLTMHNLMCDACKVLSHCIFVHGLSVTQDFLKSDTKT